MTQLLPWFAVAHALGIWLADLGCGSAGDARALAACCALAAIALRRRSQACAALLLIGATATGAASLGARLERSERAPVDRVFDARVEARACALGRAANALQVDLCDAVGIGLARARVPERIRLHLQLVGEAPDWAHSLRRGQRFRLELRLRPLAGLRNPGVPDAERRLRRQGIGALGSLRGDRALVRLVDPASGGSSVSRVISRVVVAVEDTRTRVARRLEAAGPGGALLAALSIGERSGLPGDTRDAFTRAGLAHLLAVSGLHLSIVAGGAYWLGRRGLSRAAWFARRADMRDPALLLALGVAGVYAAVCQLALPVRRAWIFLLAAWLALRAGRRPPVAHVLALAGCLILALEPAALFSAGAQLSFVVSAALLSARFEAPPLPAPRLVRGVWWLASSSAVAVAASAPVLAAHGMGAGGWGLVTNWVAIPWTAAVLLPAALATAVLCAPEAAQPCDALIPLTSGVAELTLWSVAGVGRMIASPQHSAVPMPWVLFLAFGMAAAVARTGSLGVRFALAVALCVGLRFAPVPEIAPRAPRLVVLDVGQGDAILVQGRDAAVLIDGGRALPGGTDIGRYAVLPALAALGVDRLDLVIATHADLDHRGGLASVLDSMDVGMLWLPRGGAADQDFDELLAIARRRGIVVRERGRGDPGYRTGEVGVVPLWPGPVSEGGSRNDRSLVVRVEVAGRRLLMTGDLGSVAEQRLVSDLSGELRADVLKVGHHGSAGSTSAAFLEAVAPGLAIISASCSSRMGLPSPRIVGRLEDGVRSVAWTGRDGAVLVPLRSTPAAFASAVHWGATRPCGER